MKYKTNKHVLIIVYCYYEKKNFIMYIGVSLDVTTKTQ